MASNGSRIRRLRSIAGALVLTGGVGSSTGPASASDAPPANPVPAPSAPVTVPLDRYFHGAVIGLDGSKVRLKYDFSTPEQQRDWMLGVPWNIAKDAADGISFTGGLLAVRGNVGTYHRGEWEGDLVVTCRLIPDGVKDIGGFLRSPDQLTDYVSYTLVETYFHGWDSKAGGETGMMKFGKQFAVGKGGYTGFRYLAMRMLKPEPQANKAVSFSFGRKGEDLVMNVDEMKQASVEPGNPLKTIQPGFYAVHSSVAVDEIVIEGTLSPHYVELNKIGLRTEKPIVAEARAPAPGAPAPEAPVDPAVTALVGAYEKGTKSAVELVKLLAETTRADVDRLALAGALKAGPHRAIAAVTDLLYSLDVKTRSLGIDIVKALAGKDYGYDPRAGEKSRSAAVKRLQADVPVLSKSPGW